MSGPIETFNGNLAVPIDGRIGFGLPEIGSDHPTGPVLLASIGDPNGVVTAPIGSIALQADTAALWQNTDGGTTWSALGSSGGIEVLKQRIELADLPNTDDTGPIFFGAMIPAGRVVIGGLLYMNASVDVGASGITVVGAQWGIGHVGPGPDSILITLDSIDLVPIDASTPRFLHALDASAAIAGEFQSGPGASAQITQAFYQISSDGPDLDTLAAFDVTFFVLLSPTALVVP